MRVVKIYSLILKKMPKKFIQIGSSIEYENYDLHRKKRQLKKLIPFLNTEMQNLQVHCFCWHDLERKIFLFQYSGYIWFMDQIKIITGLVPL